MGSFRIYGRGPALAYPSSADAAFVDATVKSLLDGDRTTAVVVDQSRVLYLFLGRDPTDETGNWQRYVAEYAHEGAQPPAATLALLERELSKLRLDDWGWECHPHDEEWLDALGRATAASRSADLALLARLAGDGEPTLSFGTRTPGRSIAIAAALARDGTSVAIVDGDGPPPVTADVALQSGHDADFVPLSDRSAELWEWKRDDAPAAEPSAGGNDANGQAGPATDRTAGVERAPGRAGPDRASAGDETDAEQVATDGGGLVAVLGGATEGRRRPSVGVPSRPTVTALALALLVVTGLAGATAAVLGAGPFATDPGGPEAGGASGGGPTPATTSTESGSVLTLSASVSESTVTVRGWGASGGVTVALVNETTAETVASRQVDANGSGFRTRLTAPESGSYRVVADGGGTTVEKPVQVATGAAEDGAFGLDSPERDATIRSGTLRVGGRSPTESVAVRLTDATGSQVVRTNTSVSEGEFETWITGLPAGRYTLTVSAGEAAATRTVVFD